MPVSRRALLGAVVAVALAAGRESAFAAGAPACNVASACTFADLPAACCSATSCTLDGTITVGGPVCDIDFGPRNVTLTGTGTIVLGSNMLSIEAGSLTIAGFVNGRGTSTPNHGGSLKVTTNGGTANAFSLIGTAALIDVSGFGDGGGTVEIHADGAVGIQGGKILASQLEPDASGGNILIDNSAGSITVSAPVRADAGVNGFGGTIGLTAATDLTITDTGLVTTASGALGGGGIDLEAGGAFTMTAAAVVQSTALTNSASDGGEIDVTAGSISIQGYLEAKGGPDSTGTEGGSGGVVSLEADTGGLTLAGSQGVVTDGAGGGDGGEVDLLTQSDTTGDMQIGSMTDHLGAVSASASGGIAVRPAGGGTLDVSAGGSLTVVKNLFATGAGAGGQGDIELSAAQDVVLENTIDGSDPAGGGILDVESGHDIVAEDVGFGTPIRLNATVNGSGGSIAMNAGNDLTIGTTTAGTTALNVSGANAGSGGQVALSAGRNVTILKNGTVSANTPLTSTLPGGQISITAGAPPAPPPGPESAPQTGALEIDGQVVAHGRAATAVPSPGFIQLSGCLVTIASTGTVDSTGDVGASNTVTARKSLTIASGGQLKTTNPGGQNLASIPNGTTLPPPSNGVSPPFTCSGSCTKAPCTQLNPPLPTPDCLVPCPTCGDLHVDFPEECDPPGCPNCDQQCRHFIPSGCDDGELCTTDRCDTTLGYPSCFNDPRPTGALCDGASVCNGTCTFEGGFSTCMPLICDDGNPCTADSCDAVNGCLNTPLTGSPAAGSTDCSDRCTQTCNAGMCVAITPPNCDDHNPNTRDVCDPTTGTCQHTTAPPCTSGAQCNDDNPCTADSCSAATGLCVNDPTPLNGTSPVGCNGGDACNGFQVCTNGTCAAGTPAGCGVCTSCDPMSGCSQQPIPNCCVTVQDCSDGNDCTSDSCVDNRCVHDLVPNCCDTDADCDDGNPCTMDSPCQNHVCTHTPLAPGSQPPGCNDPCSDPPAQCQAGVCVASPKVCPTDGACPEICDPASGSCIRPPLNCSAPNGQPLPCCCSADADCDDHDTCTQDTCDPDRHACANTLLFADCHECTVDTDCDPNGACGQHICCTAATSSALCPFTTGVCTQDNAYTAPDCLTGNTKLTSSCVVDAPGQAHCTAALCLCDDHNPCNGVETCGQNVCIVGTPPDCDDHDTCTDDACDPGLGCTHTPRTGFASVSCGLDAIALDLEQATAGAITPPVRAKISKLVGKARTKLSAANGTNPKRALKNLKAAGSALKAIGNAVATARRKHKIDGGLADAITNSAQGAAAAIETLKTSITPK